MSLSSTILAMFIATMLPVLIVWMAFRIDRRRTYRKAATRFNDYWYWQERDTKDR